MAIKLKLHNNPQLPQRTNTLAEYAELAGGPSAIVWKVQDSTNPRWIGKVFDKLLLKPCLRRALLNISVDWKYFQFVVLKTTDDSFSGQQLGIFRLEGYRRNKQIIPSWFFVILCVIFSTSIEFNFNIFLDWSLDNKLLTLDLGSKSRGTLWGPIMTIPTSTQLSTSACECDRVMNCHAELWHVTTPVTWPQTEVISRVIRNEE